MRVAATWVAPPAASAAPSVVTRRGLRAAEWAARLPRLPRLPWRPAQSVEPEWMDAPGHGPELIADNLDDLRRVNRLLGGVRLTLRPLAGVAAAAPPGTPLRVLDVATGGADIPRAVARWASHARRRLYLVASDISLAFLQHARAQPAGGDPLVYAVADARRLPFVDGAFHVTTCSLALHHLLPHEAGAMLAEMGRCASRGVVVNDIVRNWIGYFGAILATRFGSRNPLTRHDGPLSVRRAYTKQEMRELALRAGLRPVRWDSFLFYRVALTAAPAGSARRLSTRGSGGLPPEKTPPTVGFAGHTRNVCQHGGLGACPQERPPPSWGSC